MSKQPTVKQDQLRAFREAKAAKPITRVEVKPVKMRPLAVGFTPKKEIVGVNIWRKGRARVEDRDKTIEATKPWVAAKMSRRTWYRRQAERRDKR